MTSWIGRRVLVTGHTGFKGAWLAFWLQRLGASVAGLALPAEDGHGAYGALGLTLEEHLVDIRDGERVRAAVADVAPDVVFHLAAQALVRRSYGDPVGTYATNVLGTAHVLEAVGRLGRPTPTVVVTTDKVYANSGSGRAYREGDPLGSADPYSSSKACAELVASSFRQRSGWPVATARAGNVIGGGDVAHERLLPDVRRAVAADQPVRLRYPSATRPWQFVLDPLGGYLLLAERLLGRPDEAPAAVNFGPCGAGASVADVVERVFGHLGTGRWELDLGAHPHEASVLQLDCSLAEAALGWAARVDLERAIEWTTAWWRAEDDGADLRSVAAAQVEAYEALDHRVDAPRPG